MIGALALMLLIGPLSSSAAAVTIFSEPFATDVTEAQFGAAYPALTVTGGGYSVSGGVLQTYGGGEVTVLIPGVTGPFTISARVGRAAGSEGTGSGNVGMILGENTARFHPGYTPVPGAFVVTGPGAGALTADQDMGFVPAIGVLHLLEVTADGLGLFTIRVTNGSNPSEVYTTSFTNAGSVGGTMGLRYGGGLPGRFDDLTVSTIPEPACLALASLGAAAGLAQVRRRRRGPRG